MSLPLHESHAASYWQAYNISVPTSQKKKYLIANMKKEDPD